MSRMLSKMNLISTVQQLPKEDIETIQGYVEMIEEENQELKEINEEHKKLNGELREENQKYKEVIDKTIEYNRELSKLYDVDSIERSNADTNLLILGDKETIKKLK